MEVLIHLLGILACLGASAFFSASEIAFTGLSQAHVLLWLKEGRLGSRTTAAWFKRPDHLLVTLLVGNNLVNSACASIATLLGLSMGWPEWWTAVAVTVLLTVGGESLPKTLAHGASHRLFPALALPLKGAHWLIWPLGLPFHLLLRLLPERRSAELLQLRVHLQHVTADLGRQGQLGLHESRMIRRALDLRERRLGELMTPRTDLQALPVEAGLREAGELIARGGKSSLPLYRGDLDHIVGYVTARDLFQQPASLKEIRRDPLFVPVSMKARDLLAAFGKGTARLAVVLDEYGGTAGLLTLEDLLEDVVGAIEDEHDHSLRDWVTLADGRAFVPGRLRLDSFAERTGLPLDPEVADTLGGWVAEQLGRIPAEGECVDLPPLKVWVVSATPTRVRQLIVQIMDPPSQQEADED